MKSKEKPEKAEDRSIPMEYGRVHSVLARILNAPYFIEGQKKPRAEVEQRLLELHVDVARVQEFYAFPPVTTLELEYPGDLSLFRAAKNLVKAKDDYRAFVESRKYKVPRGTEEGKKFRVYVEEMLAVEEVFAPRLCQMLREEEAEERGDISRNWERDRKTGDWKRMKVGGGR